MLRLIVLVLLVVISVSLEVYDVAAGPQEGFDLHFIDVGQGDATLITASTGETLLVDGGRSKARIRTRLETLGITDLDAIAMTHPDADHIAGLVEVLDMFQIERIYLNGGVSGTQTFANFMAAVNAEGAEVTTVSRGDAIPLGNLTLQVLHPGTLTGNSNVDSMVLLIDCDEVEVLLTGDAESPSEQEMIQAGVLVNIDVLRVGHHGSDSSTTQEFLNALDPEVAVISAGLTNGFGHPHEEVEDRLLAAGAQIILTDTTENDDTVHMTTSDCQTYNIQGLNLPTATPTPTPTASPTATATVAPTLTPTISPIPTASLQSSGQVSWWPGDGNADDILDGNHGTLQDGASFAAGKVGQAFSLDGIDDYVDLGNAASLQVSGGDFTVDMWVRFETLSGDQSILDKMSPAGVNADGWRLLRQGDNRIWFCLGGASGANGCSPGAATTVRSTTQIEVGVWNHVAAVKSATAIAIYVNGVPEETKALPIFTDSHEASLRIGSNSREGAYLPGLVDEVDVFSRALTSAEVQDIFNAGSAGKPTPTAISTATPTPSATPTASPTMTATATGTPTPTSTVTLIPTATSTATPSATPTATETPTLGPAATSTPSPTPTPIATPIPTLTPSGLTTMAGALAALLLLRIWMSRSARRPVGPIDRG